MTDNGKEYKARRLAENLLDGPAYEWGVEDIYELMLHEGWTWNGSEWQQQEVTHEHG